MEVGNEIMGIGLDVISEYKKRLFSVRQSLKRDEMPTKKTLHWMLDQGEKCVKAFQGSEHLLSEALKEIEQLKNQLQTDRQRLKEELNRILG